MTYHDACRLNKRKGIHAAPREILRAIPGLTFKDVDHVTQWSYCSGAGGGLSIERPDLTAEISRRRVEKAQRPRRRHAGQRLRLVRAPADRAGRQARPAARGDGPDGAGRPSRARPGRTAMTATAASPTRSSTSWSRICGADDVFTEQLRAGQPGPGARAVPACTAGPSTCPTSWCCRPRAEQVSEVVKLANRHRIPVVPRAGGTGLTDGAVPLRQRHPRRRQADEPDPRDRPRRPHGHRAARHQHAQAQRGAAAATASSIPTTRPRTRARWSAAGSAPAAGR